MQIGASLTKQPLEAVPRLAKLVESLGIDALWSSEAGHDGFLPLTLAAEHTRHLALGTNIALAFPRSPMILAHAAWDLEVFSKGRFVLGLGSSVRGHLERRFSIPWHPPVGRMREVIQSLRAIWDCWQNGGKLDYRGKYYSFTLMTPHFSPKPSQYSHPAIFLAAVNTGMYRLVGEIGDGVMVHPLHSLAYLREVALPAIREGAARSGRDLRGVRVIVIVFLAGGRSSQEVIQQREELRQQVAFYASTGAYAPVLEFHGWGEVAHRLHRMSLEGKWQDMSALISDEMLEQLTVTGEEEELGHKLKERYDGIADQIIPFGPFSEERQTTWSLLARALHA